MTGSTAILAGGASRRFGSPKPLYPINGRPMIGVIADRLHSSSSDVFIVGWPKGLPPPLGLVCFPDTYVGKGTLGGIHTALTNAAGEWVFCCGCDMPLIQPAVVGRIIESIGNEDILLPVIGGVRQPLHAVYKRRLLSIVEQLCVTADTYLPDLFGQVDVRCMDEACVADIPSYALSFVSLNDRQQLEKYQTELAVL